MPPFGHPHRELLYTPQSDVHTNAAFTDSEEFAFLLGEEITVGVPERSTWVQSARWDERSQVLTITTEADDTIPCQGITEGQARVFASATSKGVWYHAVVLGKGTSGVPNSGRSAKWGRAGEATPVRGKIVKGTGKKKAAKRAWFRWW